jgi:hypothetical protein
MTGVSTLDRLTYDGYNLGYALLGPPTSIAIMAFIMYAHEKYLYLFFAVICFAFIIYNLIQYFGNAAMKSTETQILGDPTPTNDFYWMNIVILSIYTYLSVQGFLHPHKVEAYRTKGAHLAQQTHGRMQARRLRRPQA